MLNQVVLVGRLTDDLEVIKTENGKKVTRMVLAVQRSYKNSEGIYEADFIRCTLWNAVASSTSEYCKKGDIIGLKGRLQVTSYEDQDGNKKYNTEVIAEKVTFLSSKPEEPSE
ncbi:MAG TPA: single-stranded DNA-binding protein [Firmicutes bacterium]|nr:single-stranded DNA-binding protein [Bacillota bacterium]